MTKREIDYDIRNYLKSKDISWKETNGELVAKCPFNGCDEDTKPSELPHLYINPETIQYHCKKCGLKGNIVTLARHFGDDIALPPGLTVPAYQTKEVSRHPITAISPDEIETRATECHQQLPSHIKQYLSGRCISEPIIYAYKIGYGDFYGQKWITIPYRGSDRGTIGLKLRIDPELEERSDAKYKWWPAGIEPEIFNFSVLDPKVDDKVVLCEGELDALALTSKNISAVSVPCGAGTFKEEWVRYFPKSKKICLLYDKDRAGEEGAHKTAHTLGNAGKDVYICNLPDMGKGKDITDWIKGHEGISLTQLEQLIYEKWAQPYKVNPSETIAEESSKDKTQPSGKNPEKEIARLLDGDSDEKHAFPAQHWSNSLLTYGGVFSGKKMLVFSNGKINLVENEEGRFNRPKLTPECVKKLRDGEGVSGTNIVNQLTEFFSNHIFFKDSRIPALLATWTMGTYLYQIFSFYGYLWITSPVKRCGKSLLLDLLSHLCYNATGRLVTPSEAAIFRIVDADSATLVIDEVEALRGKDREKSAGLISLINAGFQRNSIVARAEANGKSFVITYFHTYSPKVLAGINSVVDTIEDRSFRILMARKRKDEPVNRFNLRKCESVLAVLRDDLHLWALRNAEKVAVEYETINSSAALEGLDDRAKDIWEPLLAIGSVLDKEKPEGGGVLPVLTAIAQDMGEDRKDKEASEEALPAMLAVVKNLIPENGEEFFVSSEDLFENVRQEGVLYFLTSKKKMAGFLNRYGLSVTRRYRDERQTRGYVLRKEWVEETEERYA